MVDRRSSPGVPSSFRRILAGLFCVVLAQGVAFAQGTMTNGANHEGTISVVGEVDEWSFTADQSDALVLTLGERVRAPDTGFRPWLRLTGPTGATLVCGNCWGDLSTHMAATAPLTGTYTVRVSSQTDAVGDYVLRLARSPSAFVVPGGDDGGTLTNGANHTGRIELADLDMWSFNANQGDSLVLSLGEVAVGPGQPDPGFRPWVRLFGPTGATLVCGNCWGDLATDMAATAPLTGTYTVVVSSQTVAAGDYVLRLARAPGTFEVPVGDQGGSMINGANHAGRIDLADLDMWVVHCEPGRLACAHDRRDPRWPWPNRPRLPAMVPCLRSHRRDACLRQLLG